MIGFFSYSCFPPLFQVCPEETSVKPATDEKVAVKIISNRLRMIASAKQEVYKTRDLNIFILIYCSKDICL